jgi:hypothetical protein
MIPQSVGALPVLDGIISPDEWSDAFEDKDIEMNNGETLNLKTIYTSTDIYFLASMDHNGPDDEIIFDVSERHDYFGIEFDLNGDEAIMATPWSPDDMFLVDYMVAGAVDMYAQDYNVENDTSNGGTNDVEGSSGSENGRIIWEVRKPLKSGDSIGYDLSLEAGDDYKIMLAFWDDRYPHSAAEFVNKRVGNSQFITLTVGGAKDTTQWEIIGGILLLASLGSGILIINYGSSIKERLGFPKK